MATHNELIARYEQGITALEEALRGIPENIYDRSPAPGKWTIRQQVAHVADAEIVGCVRLRWIAAEPNSPLKAFDQDKWAQLGYAQQSPEQSLELFRALRRTTARMLRGLPESAWSHVGNHEERGPVSLELMLELCVNHAAQHAEHIRELRKQFAAAA